MIKHALDVINSSTNYLNPGQVPVVAMDQPLYALNNVNTLINTIEELGNPFLEERQDLVALDTKQIPGNEAVTMMMKAEALGQQQIQSYTSDCLLNKTKFMYEPISRNKILLLKTTTSKISKTSQKLSSLKNDCSLFSRLYISCQTRDGDLDNFFKHENQPCPPSLSLKFEQYATESFLPYIIGQLRQAQLVM